MLNVCTSCSLTLGDGGTGDGVFICQQISSLSCRSACSLFPFAPPRGDHVGVSQLGMSHHGDKHLTAVSYLAVEKVFGIGISGISALIMLLN